MTVPAYEMAGETGPTVLMLHGIGGGRMSFEPQMEWLCPRYRMVAWDMPGYGNSRPLGEMTWATLAQSVVALIDHLGVEQVDLLGHSMGGMVAQEVAINFPARVSRLILCGTSPAFGGSSGTFKSRFLAERLKPLDDGKTPADIAAGLVQGMVGDEPDPDGVAAAIESMSAIPTAAYRQALNCLVTFDRRAALGQIAMPTLLIAGGHDRVAPPDVMQRMAEKIRGSHYHEVPAAGHLMNLEQPIAFTAALSRFLDPPA